MPSHICVSSGSSPVAFTVRIYAVFAPLLLVVQLPSSAFSVRFSFASAEGHQAEAAPGHVYRQVRGLTTQTMFWIPGQQPPLGRRRPTMVCPAGAARRGMARPPDWLPYHCDWRPVLVSKRTASRELPWRRRTAVSHSPGTRSKSAHWQPPLPPYVSTTGVSLVGPAT